MHFRSRHRRRPMTWLDMLARRDRYLAGQVAGWAGWKSQRARATASEEWTAWFGGREGWNRWERLEGVYSVCVEKGREIDERTRDDGSEAWCSLRSLRTDVIEREVERLGPLARRLHVDIPPTNNKVENKQLDACLERLIWETNQVQCRLVEVELPSFRWAGGQMCKEGIRIPRPCMHACYE